MADDAPYSTPSPGGDGQLVRLPRVLLVQDDDDLRGLVGQGLREQGFHVELAADGKSALSAAGRPACDFVVLDLRAAPDKNIAVLREMRKRRVATPVVVCCDGYSVDRRVAAWESGADQCLGPGFSLVEVAACLRSMSRRLIERRADGLSYADLRLDLERQCIERNGKVVRVTRSESALLLVFLRHPEEVLTRARLYEALTSEKPDGKPIALEVHVMRLRRKMEAHGPRLIHSVYGRGYVLTDGAAGRDGTG